MTVEPYLALVVALPGARSRWSGARQESLLARQKRHAVRMRYRTGADARTGDARRRTSTSSPTAAPTRYSAPCVLLYSAIRAAGPVPLPERADPGAHRLHQHTPMQRDARVRRHAGGARLRGADGPARPRARALDPLELRRRNFVDARRQPADRSGRSRRRSSCRRSIDAVGERARRSRRSRAGRDARSGAASPATSSPTARCIWLNDWSSAWIGFELDGTLTIRIGGARHRRRPGLVAGPDRLRGARRPAGADHDPHRRLAPSTR